MKLISILCIVRIALVPLALAKLLLDRESFPPGYETAAWWLLVVQALVALALLALARRWRRRLRWLALLNVAADFALVGALLLVYAWDPGQPLRTLPYLVVLEAALFFRLRGGVIAALLTVPLFAAVEIWRESEFAVPVEIESIVLRGLIALALGGVVGRLVDMERGQPSPPATAPSKPSGSATSSDGASTCRKRRVEPSERSAPRSTSTWPSPRSSRSCAVSCFSTARPFSSSREAARS